MTRNKLKFMGLLVSSALLVACGEKNVEQAAVESSEAAIESTSEVAESVGSTSKAPEDGNIFAQMPKNFTFASGAGAWATSLKLSEDGSFVGGYHDSDMGDSGDGYPNGTIYVCGFSGKFSDPEPTEYQNIYSMKLQELNIDDKDKLNTEEIIDEVKYVYSEPYGLENADELLIYTPGAPLSEIPEECMSWTTLSSSVSDVVPDGYYIIYNVHDGEAFNGMTDGCIWTRDFKYENGDAYANFSPRCSGSYLVFIAEEDTPASFSVKVPWDGKNEDSMVCESYWHDDDDGDDTKVKVTVKKDETSEPNKLKYVLKLEHVSDPQFDFSAWGSDEPGKLSAVFEEVKYE
ncbi:hypothetical protein [Butyrivibrio sp. AE3003]|uniref:hypothetical protein n=1 Tax=Butyrivibrio sp. AE3003 TaxID=1496721 RepID=UPI00068964AC|nr:hypothetical protein [Butyrivibrio sp. AE3003]